MKKTWIVVLAALMTAFAVNADAALITFTHESVNSGHIGDKYFTNAPFVITAVGDTDDRINVPGWMYYIIHDSASIAIKDVGTFDILITTWTFNNYDYGSVGFGPVWGGDLCDGPMPLEIFKTWGMLSSIGPLSGQGSMNPWNPVLTSGGNLYMDGGYPLPVTFTAAVASTPVPAPASILLFGSGLLAWAGLRRRFRK